MTQLQEIRLVDRLRAKYIIYINGIRASRKDVETFQECIITHNIHWTYKRYGNIINLLTV